MIWATLALAGLLGPAQDNSQLPLTDARTFIRQLISQDPDSVILSKEVAFLDEVKEYIAQSPRMEPSEAAKKWLALLDHGHAVPRRPLHNGGNPASVGSLSTVLCALPRPEVWPEISSILAKRPRTRNNGLLELLFARLKGDDAEMLRLCNDIQHSRTKNDPFYPPYSSSEINKIRYDILGRKGDVQGQIDLLRTELTPDTYQDERSPDVAALVPEQAAGREFLLYMYTHSNRDQYFGGEATRRLARKVVLENLDKITHPAWNLADGLRDQHYVEKLVTRYGTASLLDPQSSGQEAVGIYTASLLGRSDLAQAKAFIQNLKYPPTLSFPYYERRGRSRVLARFYDPIAKVQQQLQRKDMWELYVRASIASGNADAAVRRINSLSGPNAPSMTQRLAFLIDLYGALGKKAEVIKAIREVIKIPPSPDGAYFAVDKMLDLEAALDDPAVSDRVINYSLRVDYAGRYQKLIDAMLANGQFARAEKLEFDVVRKEVGANNALAYNGDEYAYRLCDIYYRARRPKDVITILGDYAFWSQEDLGKIVSRRDSYDYFDRNDSHPPIGFFAAWAFAKTGKATLAIDILRRVLQADSTDDNSYSLLNELTGADSLALYDDLFRAKTTEPRPLIWKAAQLFKLGRLEEAESTIRRAIAIDPSDSMAGPGHRLKAYEILGTILRRSNRVAEARLCDLRVKAVRLAERADVLEAAGLLPQAARMYEQSIRTSASDYVTEERLGQCLDAQGKLDQGTKHHRRAFQLLPQAFGPATRISKSCEQMFHDPGILSIGAAIINGSSFGSSDAAAYLRGQYEEEVGNPKGAILDYKRATKLDPAFYIAWQAMSSLGSQGFLDREETERAIYTVLAICPRQEMTSQVPLVALGNLGEAYRRIERSLAALAPRSEAPLFSLRTSKDPSYEYTSAPWNSLLPEPGTPVGAFISRDADISAIIADFGDTMGPIRNIDGGD